MSTYTLSQDELHTIAHLLTRYGDDLLSKQPQQVLLSQNAMRVCFEEHGVLTRVGLAADLHKLRPEIAFDELDSGVLQAGNGTLPELVWLCEAIDGAVQYLHGHPLWTLTLCLLVQGQVRYSWVYQPSSKQLYFAQKGLGAYCNQKRLECVLRQPLEICFAATSFPNYPQRPAIQVKRFTDLLAGIIPCVFAQRWMGPASLSLAQLAAGQVDIYWETDKTMSDWLAGSLLATEAGAVLSELSGGTLNWHSADILVAQAQAYPQIVEKFATLALCNSTSP